MTHFLFYKKHNFDCLFFTKEPKCPSEREQGARNYPRNNQKEDIIIEN